MTKVFIVLAIIIIGPIGLIYLMAKRRDAREYDEVRRDRTRSRMSNRERYQAFEEDGYIDDKYNDGTVTRAVKQAGRSIDSGLQKVSGAIEDNKAAKISKEKFKRFNSALSNDDIQTFKEVIASGTKVKLSHLFLAMYRDSSQIADYIMRNYTTHNIQRTYMFSIVYFAVKNKSMSMDLREAYLAWFSRVKYNEYHTFRMHEISKVDRQRKGWTRVRLVFLEDNPSNNPNVKKDNQALLGLVTKAEEELALADGDNTSVIKSLDLSLERTTPMEDLNAEVSLAEDNNYDLSYLAEKGDEPASSDVYVASAMPANTRENQEAAEELKRGRDVEQMLGLDNKNNQFDEDEPKRVTAEEVLGMIDNASEEQHVVEEQQREEKKAQEEVIEQKLVKPEGISDTIWNMSDLEGKIYLVKVAQSAQAQNEEVKKK